MYFRRGRENTVNKDVRIEIVLRNIVMPHHQTTPHIQLVFSQENKGARIPSFGAPFGSLSDSKF